MREESSAFSDQLYNHIILLDSTIDPRLPSAPRTGKEQGKSQCHFSGVEIQGISNKA